MAASPARPGRGAAVPGPDLAAALAQAPATAPAPGGPSVAAARPSRRPLYWGAIAAFSLQAIGTAFYMWELWSEILGLRTTPLPYAYQELIQILASLGMMIGLVAGILVLRNVSRRIAALNRQMEVATGRYEVHLHALFREWRLSPSEQAVTIYAMKGFSNGEIAALRSTTAATVKSQMNAVYRKTGFANRQQLIAFLVEELLAGVGPVGD